MKTRRITGSLAGLALGCIAAQTTATPIALDTTNPLNGITEIYSATFDGSLAPCSAAGAPPYCAFFNGFPPLSPPATRALVISPNPTGLINAVPVGITPVPAAGSFLDLTLDAGNQNVTLAGGVIRVPDPIVITISGSTIVTANGAGIVLDAAPRTTSVDANGVAEFLVSLAPATAADFSLFSTVVTACTGPFCALIQVLTLDMIRYRLLIDYDPTFTSFTASFIGQTNNNSVLSATLISVAPPRNVVVTDSVAPATDLMVPFGNVAEGATESQTVTIANNGGTDLTIGQIGGVLPLDPPFTLVNDTCSNQIVPPAGSCSFGIDFLPPGVGASSDSVDIPSDDPDNPTVTITVSGAGIPSVVPDVTVTDSSSPTDDQLVGFRNVIVSESASQTITVTNDGAADLAIGMVGQANPLAAPFEIVADGDGCSGQLIPVGSSCDITLRFTPSAVVAYTESLDIPSNDPDEASVTVGVSGDGGTEAVEPSPEGSDSGFMALDAFTLLGLGAVGMGMRRRLRSTR